MTSLLHTNRLFLNIQEDIALLVRELPAFVMVLGVDGMILTVNESAAQGLDARPAELVGRSVFEAWPVIAPVMRKRLSSVVHLQLPDSFEFSWGQRVVLVYLYPIFDGVQVRNVVVFGQDITDRLRVEEQVRELTAQLERKVHERTLELEEANFKLTQDKRRDDLLAYFARLLMEPGTRLVSLLQEIAQALAYLVQDVCVVFEYTRDANAFRVIAASHRRDEASMALSIGLLGKQLALPAPLMEAFSAGKSVVLNEQDVLQLRGQVGVDFHFFVAANGYRAVRAIPLMGESLFGVMIVAREIESAGFIPEELAFLDSLASLMALSMQNASLMAELRTSREMLRGLSQRLVDKQEAQVSHLASELHDQVGQEMTAISINLSIMRNMLPIGCPAGVTERMDDTVHLVESAIDQMRNIMAEFRPPVLDAYGLTAALYWYAEKFSRRTQIRVLVNDLGLAALRLPAEMEIGLFRIAQEALNNVAKHAQASLVNIDLGEMDGLVKMTICDDGRGMGADYPDGQGGHWGMTIMRERAQAMQGTLSIESPPGQGVCLTARLPFVRSDENKNRPGG